jgi:hypothetical protein
MSNLLNLQNQASKLSMLRAPFQISFIGPTRGPAFLAGNRRLKGPSIAHGYLVFRMLAMLASMKIIGAECLRMGLFHINKILLKIDVFMIEKKSRFIAN